MFLAMVLWAQSRKPGLWEVTSNQVWQQSPFPAGMEKQMGGGPHTMQVCLTQEEIDKYGAIMPQQGRSCSVNNVVQKPNGMTADLECTGPMSGKGAVESSWDEPDHAKGKVHFVGTMRGGKPIEWTVESTSVYKGPDCGNVKPFSTQKH